MSYLPAVPPRRAPPPRGPLWARDIWGLFGQLAMMHPGLRWRVGVDGDALHVAVSNGTSEVAFSWPLSELSDGYDGAYRVGTDLRSALRGMAAP